MWNWIKTVFSKLFSSYQSDYNNVDVSKWRKVEYMTRGHQLDNSPDRRF